MGFVLRFVPATIGFAIVVIFAIGLTLGPPQNIESAYKDKPLPAFSILPLFENAAPMSDKTLRTGRPVLLNVFASWCAPCRAEHGVLMRLHKRGVPIYAINYKDRRDAAKRFINRLGNPYTAIGFDKRGQAALDLGVYGVPETFLIDADGHVQMRHVGPLTERDVQEKILPYFTSNTQETENAVSR